MKRLLAALLLCHSCAQGATVFSTITPVIASEGVPVSVNLNASLGPVTDSSNEVLFVVQDLGQNSQLTVEGVDSGSVATLGVFDGERFEEGESVGSSFTYTAGVGTLALDNALFGFSLGNWGGGATAYVGIEFEISGATHYGFARVTWSPDNNVATTTSTATIDLVGFNTVPGEAAVIPIIPEPSSVFLMGIGLCSLLRRQR